MTKHELFYPCAESDHTLCSGASGGRVCTCYCHQGTAYQDEEPKGFVIKTIHAFIAVDPDDGDEGVVGQLMWDGTWMPLVCADERRLEALRPVAQAIAYRTETEIKLVRFSVREDIETLEVPSDHRD